MRFVVDAQLPPGLAIRLRTLGHAATHVHEIGLGGATDSEIWHHACSKKAILITKDQDFVGLANSAPEGVAVVLIRLSNTTNQVLLATFEPLLQELFAAIAGGEKLIEIG